MCVHACVCTLALSCGFMYRQAPTGHSLHWRLEDNSVVLFSPSTFMCPPRIEPGSPDVRFENI